MCGILGAFNVENHEAIVKKGMKILSYRGKDAKGTVSTSDYTIGHLLHSIVGFVKQPIKYEDALLIANCEIYNYKDLSKEYGLNARNDADLIIKLVKKLGFIKAVNLFDGVYALAYIEGDKVYLARDIIGEKPVWYSKVPFCFASEKKALELQGIRDIVELNPRQIIIYDIKNKTLEFKQRLFFENETLYTDKESALVTRTKELLIEAVRKRVS